MLQKNARETFRIRWLDTSQERSYQLDPARADIYIEVLRALNGADIQYVVAGAFASFAYTGIWRDTKDIDVFVKPHDVEAALAALRSSGFDTEVTDAAWLAKAFRAGYFVDLIFSMKNLHFEISNEWFMRAHPIEIMEIRTSVISIEDLIASKAYVAHRDRFDGADIAHLIQSVQGRLDWQHIVNHLKTDRELLLWHLIFFDFIYPGHPDFLPQQLMVELFEEMRMRWVMQADPKAFRGIVLDEQSFAVDRETLGYKDIFSLTALVDETGKKL